MNRRRSVTPITRFTLAGAYIAALASAAPVAWAQAGSYPNRPIKMILPHGPGTPPAALTADLASGFVDCRQLVRAAGVKAK